MSAVGAHPPFPPRCWDLSTVVLILGCKDDEGVYFGKRECVGGWCRVAVITVGKKNQPPIPPPPPLLLKQRDSLGTMDSRTWPLAELAVY